MYIPIQYIRFIVCDCRVGGARRTKFAGGSPPGDLGNPPLLFLLRNFRRFLFFNRRVGLLGDSSLFDQKFQVVKEV